MSDKKKSADEGLVENDYCDLDPTKICDNCCKCIDKEGAEYRGVKAEFDESTMRVYYADEEDAILTDLAPMDIDPILVAEWEEKLRKAETDSMPCDNDQKDEAPVTKHDAAHMYGSRTRRTK